MKLFYLLIAIISLSVSLIAADFKTQYKEISQLKDDSKLFNFLQTWEKAEPNNPEVDVAFLNYYYKKSKSVVTTEDTIPHSANDFPVIDSIHNTYNYMHVDFAFNDSLFNIGLKYADEAIKKNPKRLDIYFGKIYILGDAQRYKELTTEILNLIDLSVKNNFNWLWSDSVLTVDTKQIFKNSIQKHCYQLFNLDPPQLEEVKTISERMIKYFPKDVEYYSNMGTYYLLREDFQKALDYFKNANAISPRDVIVINNIAYTYELLKDYDNALKFYNMMIQYGDDEDAKFAKEKIEKIKTTK